jgi:hypothetical protein
MCVCVCVCVGGGVPERVGLCMCVRACNLARRMRHIVTSYVAPLAPAGFSTLSHKRRDFRKQVTEHKMCFNSFYDFFSEIFLILRITKRDIIINVKTCSCKVPVILVGF